MSFHSFHRYECIQDDIARSRATALFAELYHLAAVPICREPIALPIPRNMRLVRATKTEEMDRKIEIH
jgi:hypothetical protein